MDLLIVCLLKNEFFYQIPLLITICLLPQDSQNIDDNMNFLWQLISLQLGTTLCYLSKTQYVYFGYLSLYTTLMQ